MRLLKLRLKLFSALVTLSFYRKITFFTKEMELADVSPMNDEQDEGSLR